MKSAVSRSNFGTKQNLDAPNNERSLGAWERADHGAMMST
jgi:hypothetical protein